MCFTKEINITGKKPLLNILNKDLIVFKTLNTRKSLLGLKTTYSSMIQKFIYKKNKLYRTNLNPIIRQGDKTFIDIYKGFHSFLNIKEAKSVHSADRSDVIGKFIIPKNSLYLIDVINNVVVSNQIIFKGIVKSF